MFPSAWIFTRSYVGITSGWRLGFVKYENARNWRVTGLSVHRLANYLISWHQWEAASDTAVGMVLPCPSGRDPPPSADGQRPPQGGHNLACDVTVDQMLDLHPQAQPDVDLSYLTLDSPLWCQNHPLAPASKRDVSAASSKKQLIFLFFPLTWTTSAWQRQTGLRRALCALTWVCTFESGIPPTFSPHPHLASQRYGMGLLFPSPFSQHPVPCSRKPRMMQFNLVFGQALCLAKQ